MSAQLRPKCPHCGSYYLSTLDGEKKRKCIDCKLEFATDEKQVAAIDEEQESTEKNRDELEIFDRHRYNLV